MTKKEREFAKELGKCAGKWVATFDYRVVACGDDIRKVKEEAEKKNIDNPRIFAVPDPKSGHLFF